MSYRKRYSLNSLIVTLDLRKARTRSDLQVPKNEDDLLKSRVVIDTGGLAVTQKQFTVPKSLQVPPKKMKIKLSKTRRVLRYAKRGVKKVFRAKRRKVRFEIKVVFNSKQLAGRGIFKVATRTYKGTMKSIRTRILPKSWCQDENPAQLEA